MKRILVSAHPIFREHDTGPGHPERPERLDAIMAGLKDAGLDREVAWREPGEVAQEALFRVHDEGHVRKILSLGGKNAMIDQDTIVSPASVEAALRASGAACSAVEAVLGGEADYGFCLVRPPGHHAERGRSMGFCLFNHVAVAAAHAIGKLGVKRVLIFDPDVHHGNGTQEIFYERGDVFFISIHQWPWYPGPGAADETGKGDGAGTTLNIPLPAGSGDDDYLGVTRETVAPALRDFRPELVLFSAGFDAHEGDPLGGMRLTSEGFARMYRIVLDEMEALQIPGVFCLEGGYSLEALRTAAPAVMQAMLGSG